MKGVEVQVDPQMIVALAQRREILRLRPECRFVDRTEFIDLAVSPRPLRRSDEPEANVRGLLDLRTGTRFLAEVEKLFPPLEA